MRQEFNQIYDLLYADYIYDVDPRRKRYFPDVEYNLLRIIRREIDIADEKFHLRSDAKYFLIVNFHSLIVRPLLENNNLTSKNIDLRKAIQMDIQTIVRETNNSDNHSNNEQISGHQIMSTIDRLWRQLRTTNFDIWG